MFEPQINRMWHMQIHPPKRDVSENNVVCFFPGDFVRLDGVHLWDNVTVEHGCNISKSILCKNVHIKRYLLNEFILQNVFKCSSY